MKILRSFLLICGLIMVGYVTIALAGGSKSNENDINPNILLSDVSKRGARAIVSKLYSAPESWNYVLRQIATGNESWLRVAVALHPGSDAGSSEMLSLAVGEALEAFPENVYRIALPEYQLDSICSAPDVDDVRFNSYELSLKAIERRQKRISAVVNPELSKIGEQCSKKLEQAKAGIAAFYGIGK